MYNACLSTSLAYSDRELRDIVLISSFAEVTTPLAGGSEWLCHHSESPNI